MSYLTNAGRSLRKSRNYFCSYYICASFLLPLVSGSARGDVAPSMPLSAETMRKNRKEDDCLLKEAKAKCVTMHDEERTCEYYTWWWIPGSNERAFENGSDEYVSHVAKCENIKKKIKTKPAGAMQEVDAFKCLVCK